MVNGSMRADFNCNDDDDDDDDDEALVDTAAREVRHLSS